jgi:hypothetical protein
MSLGAIAAVMSVKIYLHKSDAAIGLKWVKSKACGRARGW